MNDTEQQNESQKHVREESWHESLTMPKTEVAKSTAVLGGSAVGLKIDFMRFRKRAATQEAKYDFALAIQFSQGNPNMKQKVTIKVAMECESCRNKALKIASMIKGVSSVAIEGDSKDKVVVTGEDVDTVCLGRMLKKKFRSVTVLTVEEVKPKKDEKDKGKPKFCTVCVVPSCDTRVRCLSPKCDGGCKPCCKCESPKCDGGCKPCCKCESPKCDGGCKPCCKCDSHKCDGTCKPCCKCDSHKCDGECKPCSRCRRYRCHGHCAAVICYGQCPPWVSCPTCCAKPPSSLCYTVVYDPPDSDSCSIQ